MGCQPLSDVPILCGQGEEAFVGRMLGGGRKGSRTPQGGLVLPFCKKAREGDMKGQYLFSHCTAAGLAGSLVDALWALGEPSLDSTQTSFMSLVQMPFLRSPFPGAL